MWPISALLPTAGRARAGPGRCVRTGSDVDRTVGNTAQ
jgi:hypothetical protein